jgi:hypothetical protein
MASVWLSSQAASQGALRRDPCGRRVHWFYLCLGLSWLLSTGCGLTMKPPVGAEPLTRVKVEGHTPSLTYRDSELRIGRFWVDDVDGTAILPAGMTAYGRMPEQTEWKYQYNVGDGKHKLRGECVETVGEVRFYGLGETTLDVHCRCLAGDTLKAELRVSRGKGKAQIMPAQHFAVFGTRGSAEGKRSRAILGYRLQSGRTLAAVDVTKQAATYVPAGLPAEDELPLTCLFGGLLLHRPNR